MLIQELQKLKKLKSNMGSTKTFHALYNDDDILLSAVKKIKEKYWKWENKWKYWKNEEEWRKTMTNKRYRNANKT